MFSEIKKTGATMLLEGVDLSAKVAGYLKVNYVVEGWIYLLWLQDILR